MAACVWTLKPVILPSPSKAISAIDQWSRPWASVRLVSVRVAVHLTGLPSSLLHMLTITSSA